MWVVSAESSPQPQCRASPTNSNGNTRFFTGPSWVNLAPLCDKIRLTHQHHDDGLYRKFFAPGFPELLIRIGIETKPENETKCPMWQRLESRRSKSLWKKIFHLGSTSRVQDRSIATIFHLDLKFQLFSRNVVSLSSWKNIFVTQELSQGS